MDDAKTSLEKQSDTGEKVFLDMNFRTLHHFLLEVIQVLGFLLRGCFQFNLEILHDFN